jgi:hypothetical protein
VAGRYQQLYDWCTGAHSGSDCQHLRFRPGHQLFFLSPTILASTRHDTITTRKVLVTRTYDCLTVSKVPLSNTWTFIVDPLPVVTSQTSSFPPIAPTLAVDYPKPPHQHQQQPHDGFRRGNLANFESELLQSETQVSHLLQLSLLYEHRQKDTRTADEFANHYTEPIRDRTSVDPLTAYQVSATVLAVL